MIGTIRKHSKWLWGVIITFTILSFVYFFTPQSGNSRYSGGGKVDYGSISGVPISQDDFQKAYRETMLVYFVASNGQWPDRDAERSGFDVNRQTYERLFLLSQLKDFNITVDSSSVAQAANNILRKFGRNGQRVDYGLFVNQALASHVNEEDFQRYLRHQVALQQLINLVSLPGEFVTQRDVKTAFMRDFQEVATEAAFFSATNYMSGVKPPTPEALAEFYTNQIQQFAAYRLPERVQVSYVSFELTNFWAAAEHSKTNLAQEADRYLQEIGTNYLELAKTPDEAKTVIRNRIILQQAAAMAQEKANAFANDLFSIEPARAENLAAMAKTNGLTVKVTAPFDETEGPKEFEAGPTFGSMAFALKPEEPLAGPVPGKDAIYIIALDKRIPSEIPPLDAIRDQVIGDYKHTQALKLARQAGAEFARTVASGLANGKTFDAIAAEAKVKPVVVPPLSMRTKQSPAVEEHMRLADFKQLAFGTPVGKATDFYPNNNSVIDVRDGGIVLWVKERPPISDMTMQSELPGFTRELRDARREQALSAWLRAGENKSIRAPLLTQPGQGKS
jgi:hypothetical protein